MRVRVRLFAMQREIAGTRQLDLELGEGATVEDAWSALVDRFPRLGPGRAAVRFARNGAYTDADTAVGDGDELAMIPPVSGGGGSETGSMRILEIRSEPFSPDILTALSARLATPEDGAVVAFLGVTRRSPGTPAPGQEAEAARHAGRAVAALTYETLEPMALSVMAEIADEIQERFGVTRLAIVAASPHRDAAFDAARYAIDETKARAPIWKAEQFVDGHVWIGEPARDSPRTEATPPRAIGPRTPSA